LTFPVIASVDPGSGKMFAMNFNHISNSVHSIETDAPLVL